jgi:RNA polymerase sigma-70 factor, ECF subfamily
MPDSPGNGDRPAPVAAGAIATHRDYLYRFALAQLRDEARAEDVVQETLLAAMENAAGFAGRAQLRTWLTGILKHKIVDIFRKQARLAHLHDPEGAQADDDDWDELYFDPQDRDHWHTFPETWSNPERALEQKRFWEVFDTCNARMPAQTARVFMMREFLGLETEDICKELGITRSNCWVLLYRARMLLRECLEMRWFGERK